MTTIQTATTSPINDRTLGKLYRFTRPARMTAATTLFDIGYERAKADLLALLEADLGRALSIDPEVSAAQRTLETQARAEMEKAPRPFWRRALG